MSKQQSQFFCLHTAQILVLWVLLCVCSHFVLFAQHTSNTAPSNDIQRSCADSLEEQSRALVKTSQNYAEAIPLQLQALEIRRRLGDSANIARALDILARGFAELGDTNRARSYSREALLLFESHKEHRHYLTTTAFLMSLERLSGHLQRSDSLFGEAEKYLQRLSITDSALIPSSLFAEKALTALSQEQYHEARRFYGLYDRVYFLRSNNISPYGYFYNRVSRAIFTAKVLCAEQRWNEALAALAGISQDSIRLHSHNLTLLSDFYEIAAKAYFGAGVYDSAFAFQVNARKIQDSMRVLADAKVIANLQIRYDVERKDERLATLEREQTLQRRANTSLIAGVLLLAALLLVSGVAYRRNVRSKQLLVAKNEQLQRLSNEKTTLLNVIAHDLKNPLLGLKMSLQQMPLQQFANPINTDIIAKSQRVIDTMLHDINGLLLAGRIESEKSELSETLPVLHNAPVSFDIVRKARMIADDMLDRADVKRLRIEIVAMPHSIKVCADEDAVHHIVENLLSNALKYSTHGTIIRIALQQEQSPEHEYSSMLQLTVQNEGAGIPKEEQHRLFQPYSKLSTKPTAGEDSSGLGLSVVKRFVDALHGEVWCESEAGQGGASFVVRLPICEE